MFFVFFIVFVFIIFFGLKAQIRSCTIGSKRLNLRISLDLSRVLLLFQMFPAFLSACGKYGNIRKRCLLHVPGRFSDTLREVLHILPFGICRT